MEKKRIKSLLEAMNGIVKESMLCPVTQIIINFTNENREILPRETVELYSLDDVVSLLMDKSIFYRIVNMRSSITPFMNGLVMFTLSPDKEFRTNIDADFMEELMKLKVKHDESKF